MSRLLPERLEVLDYWITERERMRRKHDTAAPKPWTRDPIMAGNHWCNVRRMDDRVSRWLLKHWYVGDRAKPSNVMGAATLARMVNRPDALTELLSVEWGDWGAVRSVLSARKTRGDKFMNTPAYQVLSSGSTEPSDKYVPRVASEVHESRFFAISPRSMRETWAALCEVDGLGSFLAGQVVADLRHVVPGAWSDRTWWAPVGNGSGMGMAWLLGRGDWHVKGRLRQAEFDQHLPAVCEHIRRELPEVWRDRKLEAMDAQNVCCEISKLMRLRTGIKTKRRLYTPRREVQA